MYSSVMIRRAGHIRAVLGLLRRFPVVALLGARQIGKTTLAGQIQEGFPGRILRFDLENPEDVNRLADPLLAMEAHRGLVVIDEVQRRPELFPVLRVLADRPRHPARFLVLGSASPDLLRQSSESLAGRIAHYLLAGLGLEEVGVGRRDRLWWRGGFPRSFLARTEEESAGWRREFVRTFLERDLPQFGVTIPSATLHRFWSMLAHYHGQVWNSSEFARSFGVADTTVRRYLDLLTSTFIVRQLPPWFANIGKRQVKAPKIYFRDSGLLHTMLAAETQDQLLRHPKMGASWEGFALEAVIRRFGARPEECYFWATHAGAELDLLVVRGTRRRGFEFKRTDAPRVTPSMRVALQDLKLEGLDVIHGGRETFPMAERIRAVALSRVLSDVTVWK